jgi:hypothetical protein
MTSNPSHHPDQPPPKTDHLPIVKKKCHRSSSASLRRTSSRPKVKPRHLTRHHMLRPPPGQPHRQSTPRPRWGHLPPLPLASPQRAPQQRRRYVHFIVSLYTYAHHIDFLPAASFRPRTRGNHHQAKRSHLHAISRHAR